MKEVIEIKGNLHLYGVEPHKMSENVMVNDLGENGMELRFYCGKEVPETETKMHIRDFYQRYKGKKVNVEGSVILDDAQLKE